MNAVLITNGRSTLKYAHKALQNQSYKCSIIVIENRPWIEANNMALKLVKSSVYLRVDDDMFLHPRTMEFLLDTMKGDPVAHIGKLWEEHTHRVAGAIKLYNVEKVRAMGGFRPNRLGKLDRTFQADAKKHGFEITCADKKAPLGLHACAPWKEQLAYEKLWGYKKSTRSEMRKYNVPVARQYKRFQKMVERKARGTRFWRYIEA